jgi:hypothetical protein
VDELDLPDAPKRVDSPCLGTLKGDFLDRYEYPSAESIPESAAASARPVGSQQRLSCCLVKDADMTQIVAKTPMTASLGGLSSQNLRQVRLAWNLALH